MDIPVQKSTSRFLSVALWLGDCVVLFIFTLFLVMVNFFPPRPRLEPAVAILPYLFAWTIVGLVCKAYNFRDRFISFFLKALLGWLITLTLAEAIRWLALSLILQINLTLSSILIHGLAGGLGILSWRLVVKTVYNSFTQTRYKRLGWILSGLLGLGAILICLPRLMVLSQASARLYTEGLVPPEPAAIVFGAGIWPNGNPSTVLKARIDTAIRLYKAGKVKKLILSGDGRTSSHDEIAAMRMVALENAVPDEDLIFDRLGLDTYDSCYRAKAVYHADQVILVTQTFHLVRALYVCNALGLVSIGVPSDRLTYYPQSLLKFQLREIPATLVDWLDVNLTRRVPSLVQTDTP